MQDLQEEKSQKKKKGFQRQVELPVALSVLVVAFALFSVASFGLINRQVDTVSYAAPAEGFDLVINGAYGSETEAGLAGIFEGYTTNQEFYVPYYYVGSVGDANRIFCVEHGVDASNGVHYGEGSLVDDAGLIYILKNGNNILGTGGKAEIWAKQAAIWLYQHEKHPGDTKHALPANITDGIDSVEALTKVNQVEIRGGASSGTKIDTPNAYTKIRAVVDAAKTATGSDVFSFNISRAEKMDKTPDGKYYQTGLISIIGSPADALVKYDIVNLKGVDGIKIVDESGKDLAPTNVPAGKKFYLRIPADKIADKTVRISYDINATYSTNGARYFVATDHQTLIDLENGYDATQKGDAFNIVGSPDTGMNAAQTIYFIGLIVLLCGVGIVYANTKPVESKQ